MRIRCFNEGFKRILKYERVKVPLNSVLEGYMGKTRRKWVFQMMMTFSVCKSLKKKFEINCFTNPIIPPSDPINMAHRSKSKDRHSLSDAIGVTIKMKNPNAIFTLGPILGRGSYGVVRKATHNLTGKEVAVKIIQLQKGDSLEDVRTEISILRDCHHPNIVNYLGTYIHQNALWVTFYSDFFRLLWSFVVVVQFLMLLIPWSIH